MTDDDESGDGGPVRHRASLSIPCPTCHVRDLFMDYQITATNSFSLAGNQRKVSAYFAALVTCGACGMQVRGRLINPTIKDGRFTGGHFEEITE